MSKYIKGIDVSHWEPSIDWAQVYAQDIRFVFIKATQADFSDGSFASHWAGSKKAGILRGAYHFIDPRVDGRVQAQTFLNTVTLEPGDLPPVLDLEDLPDDVPDAGSGGKGAKGSKGSKGGAKGSKGSKSGKINASDVPNAQLIACAQTWLSMVEQETGRKPIIYSGPAYLHSRMSGLNGKPPAWSMNYVLWLANYLNHEVGDNDLPFQPQGWPNWSFWQYSEHGLLQGIMDSDKINLTGVDLNFYRGTLEELYALAGATMPTGATIPSGTGADIPKPDMSTQAGDATPGKSAAGSPAGGGTVNVPTGSSTGTSQTNFMSYVIKPGDTLFAIALAHHTTVDAIVKANPKITNPNLIFAGDTLNIPQA